MKLRSTDPYTGTTWAEYDALTAEQIEAAVARAHEASSFFRSTSFEERASICLSAADLLEQRASDLALLATREMGKTLAAAEAEVTKCAAALRYYAAHAADFLADEPADAAAVGASEAWVRWEPLGTILAVMPWNYPFWQAVRFIAPAVMAGNVTLLKHASNVPGCALALSELFAEAGAPAGVVQTLLVPAAAVEALIADRRIRAVTLTGSEGAGRSVGGAAGRAIKKVVLELGGSDPFVVMPSADIDAAVRTAVKSRFQNAGQSCIAAKRFIVHRAASSFIDAFVDATESLVIGDPQQAKTNLGPLATSSAAADLQDLVDDAIEHGAVLHSGGKPVVGDGWFYPPTVLTGVDASMRIFTEEAFGPVAAIIVVDSLEDAIEVANATDFGLGANAWTSDPEEQQRLVEGLEAGAVFVNGMTASYPQLPFGGIKVSGHGRELSYLGIREFCNAKTVWKG